MINRARVENFEIRNFKIIMYTKNCNVNVFSPLKIDMFSKIAPRNVFPLENRHVLEDRPPNRPCMSVSRKNLGKTGKSRLQPAFL